MSGFAKYVLIFTNEPDGVFIKYYTDEKVNKGRIESIQEMIKKKMSRGELTIGRLNHVKYFVIYFKMIPVGEITTLHVITKRQQVFPKQIGQNVVQNLTLNHHIKHLFNLPLEKYRLFPPDLLYDDGPYLDEQHGVNLQPVDQIDIGLNVCDGEMRRSIQLLESINFLTKVKFTIFRDRAICEGELVGDFLKNRSQWYKCFDGKFQNSWWWKTARIPQNCLFLPLETISNKTPNSSL